MSGGPRKLARSQRVALRDAQEHAAGAAEPVEVIEADARELGEGDGEEREVHARDAEAEGEEADRGAPSATQSAIASHRPTHGPMPKWKKSAPAV